jgi:hypothetical protein
MSEHEDRARPRGTHTLLSIERRQVRVLRESRRAIGTHRLSTIEQEAS